jgi:hypothetical protein
MSEIIIRGEQHLYALLKGKGIDPNLHGPLAILYVKLQALNDPNTCSCKKGKAKRDEATSIYMGLPASIQNEPLRSAVRDLLGEGTLVFKSNDVEFARIE